MIIYLCQEEEFSDEVGGNEKGECELIQNERKSSYVLDRTVLKKKWTFILLGWFVAIRKQKTAQYIVESKIRKQYSLQLKYPQMTCKRHQFYSWFYIKLCDLKRQVSHATWLNLKSLFAKRVAYLPTEQSKCSVKSCTSGKHDNFLKSCSSLNNSYNKQWFCYFHFCGEQQFIMQSSITDKGKLPASESLILILHLKQ